MGGGRHGTGGGANPAAHQPRAVGTEIRREADLMALCKTQALWAILRATEHKFHCARDHPKNARELQVASNSTASRITSAPPDRG